MTPRSQKGGGLKPSPFSIMTDTQICNLALGKISAPSIVDLNEQSAVAEVLRTHFESVRREVIASSPWPFATKRVKATRLTAGPAWGYTYAFQMPTDYVFVIDALAEDESRIARDRYVVEGNQLLTDEGTCLLKYVAEVTDPNQFPMLFVNAFSHLLAARICPALTGNAQLGALLESQVPDLISKGSASNQNESRDRQVDYTLFCESISARYH